MRGLLRSTLRVTILSLLLAPGADALAPPPTAYSTAVRTPSILIDDPVNFYRFPHLARGSGGELSSFGAGGNGSAGSGVRLDLGRHGLHYAFVRSEPSRIRYRLSAPTFQVGWASRVGALRVGAAVSWSTEGEKTRDLIARPEPFGTDSFERSTFETADHRGLTLGLGWGDTGASIDVAVTGRKEELTVTTETHRQDFGGSLFQSDELLELRAEGDLRWQAVTRVRVPITRKTALRFHAAFEEQGHSIEVSSYLRRVSGSSITAERNDVYAEPYGQVWSVGARISHETGRAVLAGHVEVEDARPAWAYEGLGSTWDRVRTRSRTLGAGFSFEAPFVWRMRFLSGVRARVFTSRREMFEQRWFEDFARFVSWSDDEGMLFDFAWGVQRSFGSLHFTAMLSPTLPAGDPIALLDARFGF